MSTSHVQVLSTPTADTPGSSLLFHHENRRYLFGNLSEGTQRLFTQRRIGLSRAEQLFISGPINWHTVGGLLGMVMTIADIVKASQADQGNKNAKRPKGARKAKGMEILSSLSLHGGGNLSQVLATARRFIFRKGMPVKPHEISTDPRAVDPTSSEPDWQDGNIKVWYVPLFAHGAPRPPSRKRSRDLADSGEGSPEATQADADRQVIESLVKHMFDSDWALDVLVEEMLHKVQLPAKLFVKDHEGILRLYDGPLPGQAEHVPDIPVLHRRPWPGALVTELPRTQPSHQSLCYIVRNHPRRGKFNRQRAEEYGIKVTDFAKLTSGESVEGKDGMVVGPSMVIEPDIEGRGFAVLDIPSLSYVDAFLARSEWTNGDIFKGIDVMYWILGPGVVDHAAIQQFMQAVKKTQQSIRHVVSSQDMCANRLALESPGAVQIRLNRIDPDRFPLQHFSNSPSRSPPPALQVPGAAPLFEAAQPGYMVQLSPQVRVQDDKVVPPLETRAALEPLKDDIIKLADAARAKIAEPEFLSSIEEAEKDMPNRDAEIIPLGTGSAVPSKYRNVSATLVRVPGVGNYLFDCGENTLGSIRRLFGPEGATEVLRDLRCIWISHLHGDHHLGTASVIRAWRDATSVSAPTARLAVASHINMLHWLREYADIEDYGFARLRLVELALPRVPKGAARGDVCDPVVFTAAESAEFGLARIAAVRVDHCHGAMATVFAWPSGLTVAYSGDCRPSEAFVQIGQGATLLVHESTFEDDVPALGADGAPVPGKMAGEALAKKHCTMGEALDVARRMGARRVLLTHFSQRYPKIPVFDVEAHGGGGEGGGEKKDMVVLMAFDQMVVKLGEFRKAAAFLPALQQLFAVEEPADKESGVDGAVADEEKEKQAAVAAAKKKNKQKQKKALEKAKSADTSATGEETMVPAQAATVAPDNGDKMVTAEEEDEVMADVVPAEAANAA